ncbi:hypothetical protein GCM10023149_33430 [Mucilaginibacter gynuensis]|uniref:Histidine kinase/HSP90-like ATPase domain-containing protein n=2 Tax=Mucilaginibacter gynuensis TaxID=1302236 RepID=A0ABP8GRR8_9SPHI
MTEVNAEQLQLSIADNGIGIPAEVQESPRGTLGMRLMKGLSAELHGDFNVRQEFGTIITLIFSRNPVYIKKRKIM